MLRVKENRGITLIALVITIIILLILAGIAISQLTNSGLFNNTQIAKQEYANATSREEDILKQYENAISTGEVIGDRDTITVSKKDFDDLVAKVNSLEESFENVGQVYTKTNKISISAKGTWTDVTDATWTLPAGTWVIDFAFNDQKTPGSSTQIWTWELQGLGFGGTFWKGPSDYNSVHSTVIRKFNQETTGYFRYYQQISNVARDIDFYMIAVRIK